MFKMLVVTTVLLTLGCATSSSSERVLPRLDASPKDADASSVADCERRLEKMVEQENAMRSGPDPDFQGWKPKNIPVGGEDNPCRMDAQSVPEDVAKKEREERTFAKMRARTLHDGKRYAEAEDVLKGAFSDLTPSDAGLQTFHALNATFVERGRGLQMSVERGKSGACAFSSHKPASDLDRATSQFVGPRPTVHVWCPLTPEEEKVASERGVVIQLHRRRGAGIYVSGEKMNLVVSEGAIQGSFVLPTLKGKRRAYYRAEVLFRDGTPQEKPLRKRAVFWFEESSK